MFSKQEAAILKEQFWTRFGQYMQPVPSAEGVKVNWVNYKTGVKDVHFKMEAGTTAATIAIVLTQPDLEKQRIFFNQLVQVKKLLQNTAQQDWHWCLHTKDEHNKIVSHVAASLAGVNIYKKEDWPAIISFFKPGIIALDAFWREVKDGFVYI